MIRDPSDGSVRENPAAWPSGCYDPDSCARHFRCMYIQCPNHNASITPVIDTSTSGLPMTKAKYLARLELSREWLKDYFKPRDNEP